MAVTIVQQGKGFDTLAQGAAGTRAATLPANPATGRLCISCITINKGSTTLSVAAPYTERQEYLGSLPSVHGSLAESVAGGTAAKTATWTKGAVQNGGGQAAWGIFETDVVNAVYRTSAKFPSPANDTNTNSVASSGMGNAPVAGVVFALLGVDSSWDRAVLTTGAFPDGAADITWTNGYQTLAVIQVGTAEGDQGGAAFVLGYKEVAAGGAIDTTVTWAGAPDQGYLILSLYDTVPPGPTVSAGADETIFLGQTLPSRTATENLNGGGAITSRAWSLTSVPAGASTGVIDTDATLNAWTPTVAGTYTLQYSATNPQGTGTATATITVTAPVRTLDQAWLGIDAMTVKTSSNITSDTARIAFSTSSGMTSPVYSSASVTPDANGISKHTIPALTADTPYWYQVELGGALIGTAQSFRTLPDTSAQDFTFAFSSCRHHANALPNVNPTAFTDAIAKGIDFFLEIGDFHYRDISTNDQPLFRAGYDELFTRSNIATMLKSVPTGYVYDDHDYGGDGSNGSTASRPAAQAVYRERVPSPTLPSATGGIYHTFRVGRVRFIMLDCRSFRSPVGNADNSSKTMLGTEQKAWLSNLLNNADTPLTCIISSVGWIGAAGVDSGQDHWAYYTTERAEVAGYITANASKTKCVMLSGDAHMLAYDDGTNSVGGVPQFHAAALNQSVSTKGGPYSGGSRGSTNAYGHMTVTDTGPQIQLTYRGYYDGGTLWNTYSVTAQAGAEPGRFLMAY